MKKRTAAAALAMIACVSIAAPTPYTHQNFLNDPDEFQFAIVPDRTGGDYRGAFTNALAKVNLLRPEFVMSVGDLIQGGGANRLRAQQQELTNMLSRVIPPFYCVVGNHDIARSRLPYFPRINEESKAIWQEFFGKDTYYSFVYKNVLFVCLDTMDNRVMGAKDYGVTKKQYAWFKKTLEDHKDVRWTFVFMHQPGIWFNTDWIKFEKEVLRERKYTVFAGDWHAYYHAKRYGRDYYVLSVAGGTSALNSYDSAKRPVLKGPEYGEMDHIMWVTMTKDGPVVANIMIDGIFSGEYLNQRNTKSNYWNRPIDIPPDPELLPVLKERDLKRAQDIKEMKALNKARIEARRNKKK